MGRPKLPTTRYKQQVKTFKKNHGPNAYQAIGSEGGKKSPTKFTSESGRKAALASWDKRRAKALEEQEKTDEGQTTEI